LRRNLSAAIKSRNFADAEALLVRLRQEEPLAVTTRGFELELLLRQNRLVDAEALATQLCQAFPESSRIHFLTGELAFRQKRYDAAERHFRECARLHPLWSADRWLGKTLTNMGRFDEAWSLLEKVKGHDDQVHADLGWLFERKGDLQRALAEFQAFADSRPQSEWARDQVVRIKAKLLDPQSLVDEMEGLADLDEAIPDTLLPEYVEKLFKTGKSREARELLADRTRDVDVRLATRLGWVCYHAMAYDLAYVFFTFALPANLHGAKFLTSFEKAAGICHRIEELVELYRDHASQAHNLHGRIKTLVKRL